MGRSCLHFSGIAGVDSGNADARVCGSADAARVCRSIGGVGGWLGRSGPGKGSVGQSVALVGGWDGAVRGGADLKYAWVHLTEKLPADAAETEIVRAFNEWAKYAKLTFAPTSNAAGS